MTKKKSILIVAIIAVLVVAISGVSFATWQAFVKPADQTWTVTAKNPQLLTIVEGAVTAPKYNGETGSTGVHGVADDVYKTTKTLSITSTVNIMLSATVVVTAKLVGSNTFEAVPAGASVKLSYYDLPSIALVSPAEPITVTVTFPDLSAPKYYGAEFNIAVTIDGTPEVV